MKKLLCAFILFATVCDTSNVSKISRGVKVITKCCQELTASKKAVNKPDNTISSILPAFFWDTKSMIR